MSSIAEKIKQKLEAFNQYNYEEPEEKDNYLSESEEEPKIELESLNIEKLKRNSLKLKETNEEFQTKYLIEKNIEICGNSQSCKNFEVERNTENNYLFAEKDLNYKINEYVTNKLNKQGILSPTIKNKKSLQNNKNYNLNRINLNIINNNNINNLNYHTNYSTDHTQNIDSNGKKSNFNYIELGNFCEETFDYAEDLVNTSSDNSSSILNCLKNQEKLVLSKKASSGSSEANNNNKNNQNDKSFNYNEKKNFTLQKISSFGNKESSEMENTKDFDEIEIKEKESFYYQKFEERSSYNISLKLNNEKEDNVEDNYNLITNRNDSIWRRIFMPSFYFLEEFIFVVLMISLLILDPVIIFILKLIDFIYEKLKNWYNNYNQNQNQNKYTKLDSSISNSNNNINNNNLLFYGEIEEIDFNNLENFNHNNLNNNNNFNYQRNTFCEKYFNYFFNNCVYKKQRNVIKICFIVIALVMNIYILTNVQEKATKLLLFFLNNLYLLYHTMDMYNEKLLNYTENLGWFKIMNSI